MPIIVLLGFVVGLPALAWTWNDLGRFPSPVWYWSGHRREVWRTGLVLAYLATGWPALVVTLAWWRSRVRTELREEARFRYESHKGETA